VLSAVVDEKIIECSVTIDSLKSTKENDEDDVKDCTASTFDADSAANKSSVATESSITDDIDGVDSDEDDGGEEDGGDTKVKMTPYEKDNALKVKLRVILKQPREVLGSAGAGC
jgi:hypothetical protein